MHVTLLFFVSKLVKVSFFVNLDVTVYGNNQTFTRDFDFWASVTFNEKDNLFIYEEGERQQLAMQCQKTLHGIYICFSTAVLKSCLVLELQLSSASSNILSD